MLVVAVAAFLLGVSFVVHVAIWRLKRPRNSAVALTAVFVGCGLAGAGVLFVISAELDMGWARPTSVEWGQLAILYFAAMAGYINTYPAVEADSPTLFLATVLAHRGEEGIALEDLESQLGDDVLIKPGLRSLVAEHMVAIEGGLYRLTTKGRAIAVAFKTYRRLTGRGIGG